MKDTLTFQLLKPIEFAGETMTEITLREPKVSELEWAQQHAKTSIQTGIFLLVKITGKSEAMIKQMGQRDFIRATDFLAGFSEGGDEIGGAPSPSSPDAMDGAQTSLER